MGLGGAYGKGEVYEREALIGVSSLTQLTIGFQLGGQAYSEIIFFKDKEALDDFKGGNFELGAQASAVAATAGASADASYDNGVAIFTLAKGGLMYEASIGGQKFSFEPI
jgi:lipid-binding SYLF domain-containing protein